MCVEQKKLCENLPQWDLLSLNERVTGREKRGLVGKWAGLVVGWIYRKGSQAARASSYMRHRIFIHVQNILDRSTAGLFHIKRDTRR